jgi:hypothetical protein
VKSIIAIFIPVEDVDASFCKDYHRLVMTVISSNKKSIMAIIS